MKGKWLRFRVVHVGTDKANNDECRYVIRAERNDKAAFYVPCSIPDPDNESTMDESAVRGYITSKCALVVAKFNRFEGMVLTPNSIGSIEDPGVDETPSDCHPLLARLVAEEFSAASGLSVL